MADNQGYVFIQDLLGNQANTTVTTLGVGTYIDPKDDKIKPLPKAPAGYIAQPAILPNSYYGADTFSTLEGRKALVKKYFPKLSNEEVTKNAALMLNAGVLNYVRTTGYYPQEDVFSVIMNEKEYIDPSGGEQAQQGIAKAAGFIMPFKKVKWAAVAGQSVKGVTQNLFKKGIAKKVTDVAEDVAVKEGTEAVAKGVTKKTVDEISAQVRKSFPSWSDEAVAEYAATQAAGEAAGTATRSGLKTAAAAWAKKHPKLTGAGVLGLGLYGLGSVTGGGSASSSTSATTTELSTAGITLTNSLDVLYNAGIDATGISQAITQAQANGIKLSPTDLTIIKTRYLIPDLATSSTAASTIGVFLGSATTTQTPATTSQVNIPWSTTFGKTSPGGTGTGFVDLIKYKQSFPIGDQDALNAFAKKVTDAGFTLSGNDPIKDLRGIWDSLGQYSVDASRQGKQITPEQAFKIIAGLAGGNGGSNTTTNTTYSPTSKEDVKKLLNTQLQTLTGRTATNAQLEAFYKSVTSAESKKGTKTITTRGEGGNSSTKIVPGYGQQDILADAEKIAQQDPMYKQLQSSNVFGDALSQALGVR